MKKAPDVTRPAEFTPRAVVSSVAGLREAGPGSQTPATDLLLAGPAGPVPGGGLFPPGSGGWPGLPACGGGFFSSNPGTGLYWKCFGSTPGMFVCGLVNFHTSVSPLGLARYIWAGRYGNGVFGPNRANRACSNSCRSLGKSGLMSR
jgi:hypothetical protein